MILNFIHIINILRGRGELYLLYLKITQPIYCFVFSILNTLSLCVTKQANLRNLRTENFKLKIQLALHGFVHSVWYLHIPHGGSP